MTRFTCGATSGRWSMSCSAPRPCSAVGARAAEQHAPATCASCAFFSAVIVLVRPGPGGDRRHAGRAGQPRDGVGGEHRGGLVAHVDDADAARLGRDQDRRDVPAAQREDARHAVRLQRLGDAVAAVAQRQSARAPVAQCQCTRRPVGVPALAPAARPRFSMRPRRIFIVGVRKPFSIDQGSLRDDDHVQLLVVGDGAG